MTREYLRTISLSELHNYIQHLDDTPFDRLIQSRLKYKNRNKGKERLSQEELNSLSKLRLPTYIDIEIYRMTERS